MKRLTAVVITAVLCVLVASCSTQKAEWTQWRGPLGDGSSVNMSWDVSDMKELWRANVGKGHSAVVSDGVFCYTQGNKMEIVQGDTLEKEWVSCLDAATGKEVWHYAYACPSGTWPGPGATPTLHGDRLYTLGREGRVNCFDAATGTVVWERDLAADSLAPKHLYAGSPVIVDEVLFLNVNKGGMGLNKDTGELIWNSEKGSATFGTPVLVHRGNHTFGLLGLEKKLALMDLKTGEHFFDADVQWATASPILINDSLLTTCGGAALYKLSEAGLDEIWKDRKLGNTFQSFVVQGNYAYGFSNVTRSEQLLTCFDWRSGAEMWRHDLGQFGALALSDGKLVVVAGNGDLVVAKAQPEKFEALFSDSTSLTMHDNTGIDRQHANYCWTDPSMADGKIYIKNNYGDITCFTVETRP